MAADYNRELLCVPHRIQDIHGHGSHTFLRLGATLVSEPSHILEALRLEVSNKSPDTSALGLSLNEQIIYEIVTTPCSRDAVLRTSTLPANETLAALLSLELKQMIVESFGLWQQKK
jgi:predicted Rossmann fold nucleotide-binding protein DprA/Smf involved in DNA uptake